MRPLIGISPDTHDGSLIETRSPDERIVYLWDRYIRAVAEAGGAPVILPVLGDPEAIAELAGCLDGLLLAGGDFDVPPEFYGEERKPYTKKIKPDRSRSERAMLERFLESDKAVLGICGGMQLMNVAFGGTLYQDIVEERPGSLEHAQKIAKTEPSHEVVIEDGSILHGIVKSVESCAGCRMEVNSTHHQAVKDLGEGLSASATAPDGVVEAVESKRRRFVVGLQWHPEMLYKEREEAALIFKAFVAACAI